jgi:hypothetical protein
LKSHSTSTQPQTTDIKVKNQDKDPDIMKAVKLTGTGQGWII